MPRQRKHQRLIAKALTTPWAILPAKLDDITAFFELRASGIRLSKEEISARIGTNRRPADTVSGSKIAVLNLFGSIVPRANAMSEYSGGTSAEEFGRAFRQVVNDPDVGAILLRIDSPGGVIAGVPELAQTIFDARGQKPIVAMVDPMAASAAYWIATAADEIVATPSATDVGSIGVLIIHSESSKADAKAGIKYTVMRSVTNKAEANPFEPLTKAAREFLESRVATLHTQFVAAVARHRNVPVETVNERFGNGRSFLAADSLQRGMIDRIATYEQVLDDLGVRIAGNESSTQSHARNQTPPANITQPVTKDAPMDPKTKLALCQTGLAKATDSDDEFTAALDLFYEARGEEVPDDADKIVAALTAKQTPAATPPAQPPATPPAPTADEASASGDTLSAEDLTALVRMSSLAAPEQMTLLTELLAERASLSTSQVLDRVNSKSTAGNPPAGATTPPAVTVDGQDKFVAAARDAIVTRSWGRGNLPEQIYDYASDSYIDWKPEANGRDYGLQSLPRLAERCLIESGVSYQHVSNMAPTQLARLVMGADPRQVGLGFLASDFNAYNVTGMFSNIMLDVANVTLRRSYDDGRVTYHLWMRRGQDVKDFKLVHKVIAGELGDPKAIPEDGDFEETTLSDGKEAYRLTIWGQIFSHSWQLIVNDQMSSFTEIPAKMGRAMRRKENRIAYQQVKDNAVMADTGTLFNATAVTSAGGHANVSTGALTTVADYIAAFNTMSKQMGQQKGLDADSGVLNLLPEYIVFPMALRGIIRQTLGSPSGDTNNPGLTNIWQQGLTPIEEGELGAATNGGSDTAFYHAANGNDIDTIEYAFLQGLSAPVIEQQTAFSRLAMRRRIYHAFAAKPLDFRGLQKHNGA